MLEFHVTHVDVHECRPGKEVIRLTGDDRNAVVAILANMPRCGDASYAVSDNDDVLHARLRYDLSLSAGIFKWVYVDWGTNSQGNLRLGKRRHLILTLTILVVSCGFIGLVIL